MSEERVKLGPGRTAERDGNPPSPDGQKEKKPYKPGPVLKLAVSLCAACAVAAGLLFLLAWVSFRMRFSADVVRAGIFGLYVVPCLAGGRITKGWGLSPAPLWGAVLGAAYYGVLLAVSLFFAPDLQEAKVALTVPVLCIVSALLGSLMGKKNA